MHAVYARLHVVPFNRIEWCVPAPRLPAWPRTPIAACLPCLPACCPLLPSAELHDIMQAVDERSAQVSGGGAPQAPPPPRIIVGATSLLRPGDLCGRLFADLQAA